MEEEKTNPTVEPEMTEEAALGVELDADGDNEGKEVDGAGEDI